MPRVIQMLAAVASLSLAVPAATQAPAAVAQRPAGYPRSYDALIENARAERQVIVYANADTSEMAPVIQAFQRRYPGVVVRYADLGSIEMYRRFVAESRARKPSADLVWSSAMDQQVKLINDGLAQAYASPEKPALPPTAVWKNMGFGVTAEPIGYVYNRKAVSNPPTSHAALEATLRRDRRELIGKVATFDPARSNTGYLYLTQDYAITRDTRSLVEAIAATRPHLEITTEPMLRGVAEGKLTYAYNVIGSYAQERARRDPRIGVIFPRDYTIVMSRIAFIARDARHPAAAKLFLDFLLSREGQSLLARNSLWPARSDVRARRLPADQARPVRVGPQLLVNLDMLKRRNFLRDWNSLIASGAKTQ